jgi:hypothetical protein
MARQRLRSALKKFPEWRYYPVMVGHMANTITFKHARTHTCSIDPTIVGSIGGTLLLESSRKFGRRIQFYAVCGSEECHLELHFQSREQPRPENAVVG